MSDAAAKGRPMKFPYTYSAKIAQFPFKFYWQNNWQFRYFFFASAICFPIFCKIGKLSYDPSNVRKWEETRRKEFSGHH